MSDAPERVCVLHPDAPPERGRMGTVDTMEYTGQIVEYIRADLAGLPEELASQILGCLNFGGVAQQRGLLRDILAWHERGRAE